MASAALPKSNHAPHFSSVPSFVTERILVLNGTAMVELNGIIYVVPEQCLVTIAPGIPHTWTACPAGVLLPDQKTVSSGGFLMVYEYEAPTSFFPTMQTETLRNADEYRRFEGDLSQITFPKMKKEQVADGCFAFWNQGLEKVTVAGDSGSYS